MPDIAGREDSNSKILQEGKIQISRFAILLPKFVNRLQAK